LEFRRVLFRSVRNFDPNCYLYLSRSMDWYDIGESCGGTTDQGLARIRVERALAIGVHTDILFPLQQQRQIADGLHAGGAQSRFLPRESPQGHDRSEERRGGSGGRSRGPPAGEGQGEYGA